jgi:secreted PhoX family phosphatase
MFHRARAAEALEDKGSNDSKNETISDIISTRLGRRDFLRGSLAVSALSSVSLPALAAPGKARFSFKEIEAGSDENHHVAEGYDAKILMRWGDAVLKDAPAFNPMTQSADAQKLQFGYNNDFIGYIPMPGSANPARHGLLVVNHEYTNEELMFAGIGIQKTKEAAFAKMTKELVDIEIAAHGGSILEVKRDGDWQVVAGSKYARRITGDMPIEVSGPAAGHERLRTKEDPSGRVVKGMLNNCAGGVTPWGTWLTCEENFNFYFRGATDAHPEAAKLKRYGIPGNMYAWGKFYDRFDVSKEPNEPNRYGWVVEIDPFDPTSTPKKRTALGRTKHEGAAGVVAKDGRYVVYLGDDERFDYVYKFVTKNKVDLSNLAANRNLLDEGTLYVARYKADGSGEWLPLVFGQGALTAEKGFASQADILIDTRIAADAVGATKMDRPEDVKADPLNNRVYVALTNNNRRTAEQVDAANPRAVNRFGHIIEMMPDDGNHTATGFRWEILLKAGDHTVASTAAQFHPDTTKNGWFGMPDNVAIDSRGGLWVATDGNSPSKTARADGIWAVETEGELRGLSKHFYRVPAGAEMCGPCFTPDDETLFVAVQHPGETEEDFKVPVSTFDNPTTRWPDFKDNMPPRPSIVAITKRGGGRIGS